MPARGGRSRSPRMGGGQTRPAARRRDRRALRKSPGTAPMRRRAGSESTTSASCGSSAMAPGSPDQRQEQRPSCVSQYEAAKFCAQRRRRPHLCSRRRVRGEERRGERLRRAGLEQRRVVGAVVEREDPQRLGRLLAREPRRRPKRIVAAERLADERDEREQRVRRRADRSAVARVVGRQQVEDLRRRRVGALLGQIVAIADRRGVRVERGHRRGQQRQRALLALPRRRLGGRRGPTSRSSPARRYVARSAMAVASTAKFTLARRRT